MTGIAPLVELVLERTDVPLDRWEAAALLESEGVRDVDARERYGRADVFALADDVYAAARARVTTDPPTRPSKTRDPLLRRAGRGLSYYASGSFFLVPMTIQLVTLFVFGFGLWISLDFSNAQFTIVAVATILSFLVADGFVASLGRLATPYLDLGKHHVAQAVVRRLLLLGVAAAVLAAGAWIALDATELLFPLHLVLVGAVYLVLLCALWLCSAVLYVVRHRLAIVVATAAGLGTVGGLHSLDAGLYVSHWTGIAVAAILSGSWGAIVLRHRSRGITATARLARLPRTPLVLRSLAPYFLYGGVYYGFLFADRMVAWSAGGKPDGYVLWFRTPYELGLDWALASLLPALALLEYTITQFSLNLVPWQERTPATRIDQLNRTVLAFYRRQLLGVGLLTAASIGGMYALGLWLRRFDHVEEIRDFFESPVTFDVHHWGVAAYALLVLGLLNGVFLGSLARPWLVLRALASGLLASVAVGVAASRAYEYWHAVVGLTAGAAVFALLTSWSAVRLLRRSDYHYYASY